MSSAEPDGRSYMPDDPELRSILGETRTIAVVGLSSNPERYSFEVETPERALEVCRRTELFFLAESLGGVESLIEHPGRMTHASVAGSPLEVPSTLVRLSVGIEHPDDLVEDLQQALSP